MNVAVWGVDEYMKSHNKCIYLIVVLCALCVGCDANHKKNHFSVVEVANISSNEIHASLSFQGKTQSFGVISPGLSKVIGFGYFEIGSTLIVKWDTSDAVLNRRTKFETRDLIEFAGDQNKLYIAYEGGNRWIIKIYDSEGIPLTLRNIEGVPLADHK